MKIIKASATIISNFNRQEALHLIELAARTCYKSECKITDDSASAFVRNIAQVKKHESVIEHYSVTVKFICDRGISHEIVRHRLASYSQESTRYCNYSGDKFDSQLTFIAPSDLLNNENRKFDYENWRDTMEICEDAYLDLLDNGVKPQIARSVLPNSLKTELIMTANLREWKHVFIMRASKQAHPQMREIMIPLCLEFQKILPEIYDDIVIE